MTETASTTPVVDEQARFRAMTALGLALVALLGGGLFATSFQWLATRVFNGLGSDRLYFTGGALPSLVLGAVALWLATTAQASADALARPLARASVVLAALSIVGGLLLAAATFGGL